MHVSGRGEWGELVECIREDGDSANRVHMARLYALAVADGIGFLKSFRSQLGEDRLRDLIHDLLAERLDVILAADEPRAYFCIALKRKAISWVRRGDAEVAEDLPGSWRGGEADGTLEEARRAFVMDAREALGRLSARDRGIVVAAGLGSEREEIAREFNTTRANVDQIVSRFRKRFEEGEEGEG